MPNLKANSSLPTQEISRISRNPKIHYRNHKSRVPSHVNEAHNFPSYLNIHFNSIHPSTPFRNSDYGFPPKYSRVCYNEHRRYNERGGILPADVARVCA